MSEPADGTGAARLDELTEVTKDYARYSRTAYGLAFVATGFALIALVAADFLGHLVVARMGYLLLPPAWLLLLAAARGYYQRHGTVLEPAQRVAARGWILGVVYFLSASSLAYHVGRAFRWVPQVRAEIGWMALVGGALVVFGIVAVPLLTAEIVRGKLDAAVTLLIVWFAFSPVTRAPPILVGDADALDRLSDPLRGALLAFGAVAAVCLVAQGILDHRRYRLVERRLAALRGSAS